MQSLIGDLYDEQRRLTMAAIGQAGGVDAEAHGGHAAIVADAQLAPAGRRTS